MKKFLALFLVLVLAFSCVLVSCNKGDEDNVDNGSEGEDDNGFIGFDGTSGTTSGSDGTGSGSSTTVPTGNTYTDFTFTDVNETVYVATGRLSVRKDTRVAEDTYKATITFGQSYKRIKYNAAWSVIEYDGGEYYVSSKYLTTNDGAVVFTDVADKTMYVDATKSLNLRYYTNTEDEAAVAVLLKRGAEVTQTGVSKDGLWARVKTAEFDSGNTELYCKLSYLSETVPSSETTNNQATPPSHG